MIIETIVKVAHWLKYDRDLGGPKNGSVRPSHTLSVLDMREDSGDVLVSFAPHSYPGKGQAWKDSLKVHCLVDHLDHTDQELPCLRIGLGETVYLAIYMLDGEIVVRPDRTTADVSDASLTVDDVSEGVYVFSVKEPPK